MTFDLQIVSYPNGEFQPSVNVCEPEQTRNSQTIICAAGHSIYLGSGTTIEAAIAELWRSLANAGLVLPDALMITRLQFSSP